MATPAPCLPLLKGFSISTLVNRVKYHAVYLRSSHVSMTSVIEIGEPRH
jgi:hypothetical protein